MTAEEHLGLVAEVSEDVAFGGPTGWIGPPTVTELFAAGHRFTGRARPDASAAALKARGTEVLRGNLDDLESIGRHAAAAEAVIIWPTTTTGLILSQPAPCRGIRAQLGMSMSSIVAG